jgi:hypothetical protein
MGPANGHPVPASHSNRHDSDAISRLVAETLEAPNPRCRAVSWGPAPSTAPRLTSKRSPVRARDRPSRRRRSPASLRVLRRLAPLTCPEATDHGVNSQPGADTEAGRLSAAVMTTQRLEKTCVGRPPDGERAERGHLMKQQVRGRVEHWSAYKGRHGGLFVGAPRTADRPRRWFQRLRSRHGGAAYGPPRGTQAENHGLTHRVSTMYRVGRPIYAHSSITACADAVCGRTLPRHAFFEHPSSRIPARGPGQQPAHAREDADARSRRGAAGSGGCRRAGRQEAGARAAHRCLARAGLVGLLGSPRINGLVRQWRHCVIVEVIESAGAAVGTR